MVRRNVSQDQCISWQFVKCTSYISSVLQISLETVEPQIDWQQVNKTNTSLWRLAPLGDQPLGREPSMEELAVISAGQPVLWCNIGWQIRPAKKEMNLALLLWHYRHWPITYCTCKGTVLVNTFGCDNSFIFVRSQNGCAVFQHLISLYMH